jgi:CRISPR/Cas system-associated exonuclease Cas4 (RecB family)
MPKTAEIMQKLHQYAFSASSLQSYIRCPLQFYFQHLIKIREPQALTDNLEAYELGTVIHGIYKLAFDVIAKEDDTSRYSAILQHFIDHCDELVCQEIRKLQGRESLTDEALNQGAWRINRKIIDETVCQYLEMAKTELVTLPWKVIANEMPVDIRDYGVTPIDGRPSFPVRLVGSLDRVQKNGAEVQILDYKTGKVEEGKLKIKVKSGTEGEEEVQRAAIKTIFTDVNHDKLFQLVMYALMYDHLTHGQTPGIQAGIISTREINKKNPAYMLPGSILNDYNILTYKTLLKEELNLLFCQIFDDRTPFTQTDDEKVCRNCDFVHLCGRQTVSS